MSSFSGKTAEIQRLSIDRFDGDNLLSTCFMLSHCHTDHMEGIQDSRFISRLQDCADVYLYCSAITAAILRHSGLSSVAHKLKELPVEGASIVRVPATGSSGGADDEIAVTMIPAGHCPGSVMFLLESSRDAVLYTGDFRLHRGDVSRLRALHNADGTAKRISALYLDTSFLTSSRGRRSFPSRDESARELCRLVGEWLRRGERHIVNIRTSARYGSEYLFVRLRDMLGVRVHVSPALHRVYRHVPDICRAVTDDPHTPVHACREEDRQCGRVRDPALEIRRIKPSALYFYNAPEDGRVSVVAGNRCRVAYSCHSSHEEIEHVVSYLRPSKIEPCVVPYAMTRDDVVNICNKFRDGYQQRSPDGMEVGALSAPLLSLAGCEEVTTSGRAACSVQRVRCESSDEDDDDESPVSSQDTSSPLRHCRAREDETLGCVTRGTCEDDSPLLSPNRALPCGNKVDSDDDSPISSPGRPSAHGPVLPMRWVTQPVGASTKLFAGLLADLPINGLPVMSGVGLAEEANRNDQWACTTNDVRHSVSGQANGDRLAKKFKSN